MTDTLTFLKDLQVLVESHILSARTGSFQTSVDIKVLEEIKTKIDSVLHDIEELYDIRTEIHEIELYKLLMRILFMVTEAIMDS